MVDWELGSLSAVGSRFRTEEPWQQSVGIRPAFGFASILRFDHRRTNLSGPYSASFEQLCRWTNTQICNGILNTATPMPCQGI
jgi:hypothetical protein